MNGLIQDGDGDTSHKRFINVAAAICAIVLTIGVPAMCIMRGAPDIGTGYTALILGMWTIAAGGAVASNLVERK
jgi:hypothetical protein